MASGGKDRKDLAACQSEHAVTAPSNTKSNSLTIQSNSNGGVTFSGDVESIQKLILSICVEQNAPTEATHGNRSLPTAPSQNEPLARASAFIALASQIKQTAATIFHQGAPRSPQEQSSRDTTIINEVAHHASTSSVPSVLPKRQSANLPAVDETNYLEQLGLYGQDLWPSFTPFCCPLCKSDIGSLEGVVLKNCLIHSFCRGCLRKQISDSQFREVSCPLFEECDAQMSENEIFALLDDFKTEKRLYLAKLERTKAENDMSLLKNFVEDADLMPNFDASECPICLADLPQLNGVVPKNCGKHTFCRGCLRGAITISDIPLVKCPAPDCLANLQDREVRLLASDEEYQALHQKGVQKALTQRMMCQTVNCKGIWYASIEGDNQSTCPECGQLNTIE